MRPELIKLPFPAPLDSIKSYGLMMVIGFFAAIYLAGWRARKLGANPDHAINLGVLALLGGVVGARVFYVIHYWDEYARQGILSVFAIWQGGLEFYGGFLIATGLVIVYLIAKKVPALRYLDILAPSLMLGHAFGRLGCFLNGCCFGAVCAAPWAVTFPYGSIPFTHQWNIRLIDVPPQLITERDGHPALIPWDQLSPDQRRIAANIRMRPIQPAQLYSATNSLLIAIVLSFAFRVRRREGQVFTLLFILYPVSRFLLEMLRADNPVEFTGFTISQNISLLAVPAAVAFWFILNKLPTPAAPVPATGPTRAQRRREARHRNRQ